MERSKQDECEEMDLEMLRSTNCVSCKLVRPHWSRMRLWPYLTFEQYRVDDAEDTTKKRKSWDDDSIFSSNRDLQILHSLLAPFFPSLCSFVLDVYRFLAVEKPGFCVTQLRRRWIRLFGMEDHQLQRPIWNRCKYWLRRFPDLLYRVPLSAQRVWERLRAHSKYNRTTPWELSRRMFEIGGWLGCWQCWLNNHQGLRLILRIDLLPNIYTAVPDHDEFVPIDIVDHRFDYPHWAGRILKCLGPHGLVLRSWKDVDSLLLSS